MGGRAAARGTKRSPGPGKHYRGNRMIGPNGPPPVAVKMTPSAKLASRTKAIGGVGELGVPTLTPAPASACFRLTNARIRALPLCPDARMGGL